jgi:hypothetical protein
LRFQPVLKNAADGFRAVTSTPQRALGQALQAFVNGEMSLRSAMKKLGFSDEEIEEAVAEQARKEAKEEAR